MITQLFQKDCLKYLQNDIVKICKLKTNKINILILTKKKQFKDISVILRIFIKE